MAADGRPSSMNQIATVHCFLCRGHDPVLRTFVEVALEDASAGKLRLLYGVHSSLYSHSLDNNSH